MKESGVRGERWFDVFESHRIHLEQHLKLLRLGRLKCQRNLESDTSIQSSIKSPAATLSEDVAMQGVGAEEMVIVETVTMEKDVS